MSRRPGRELAVGSFAALALLVLSLAVMSIGTDSELFVDSVEYRVLFPDAGGLRVGSPVKLSGVQVGSVRSIALPADPALRAIEVVLRVESRFAPRIRQDAKASVKYLQLVSGEKYVEISQGSEAAPPLAIGAALQVEEGPEIFEQGADIAQSLTEVIAALNDILRPLREGEGLLGELIQDPNFGKEGLARLKGTLENLEAITSDLRAGRGFVGRALTDRDLAARLDDLAGSIEGFGRFVARLDRGDGAVGAMLQEGGPAERAVDDLAAAAASLRRVSESLERREGLVGRLLHDPEWSEGLAADLRASARNVAEISRKVNEGQGTLGALVNERVLHDQLESVVAGVDDSKFARWLIRHYRKRGIELETAGDDDEAAPKNPAPPPGSPN